MGEMFAGMWSAVDWAAMGKSTIRIIIILIVASVLAHVLGSLIRMLRVRISQGRSDPEEIKRFETLGRVFRHIVSVVVSLVAIMLVLSELGINIAPILGAAGVVGIAVGFGAQSLIKDYFNGFFMLLENQIRKGDVVIIAGKGGLVEEVTLRHVRLRDYSGDVYYIPNGMIDTVANKSREYAYAVIDVGVAYRESLDEVMDLMAEVAAEMRQEEKFGLIILEPLEMAGVDNWGDSSIIIRCRFKVRPLEQWSVRRAYLKRLKDAFDKHGIEIPYPHLTVYAGQGKDGSAPPFLLQREGVVISSAEADIRQDS